MSLKTNQKFIIPQVTSMSEHIILTGQDARHIVKVLRLKPEDMIQLTDGLGNDYIGRILNSSVNAVEIEVIKKYQSQTESVLKITLLTGMLKDKKMDMIIKHVTQLGIHQWIPFFCSRSVPTPDTKRLTKRLERWKTISNESLKQCRRSRIVDISQPLDFEKTLEETTDSDVKIAFWEKSDTPLNTLSVSKPIQSACILIGPEGGLSEDEIQLAYEKGFASYSLGPRILRAETAAISSCTLIQHILGDL